MSSISNFETFQSNRLKLRIRGEDKKPKLAHTLNGSALALARIVAALSGEQPNAGRHPHPEGLAALHGLRHDHQMNRGILFTTFIAFSLLAGTSACRQAADPALAMIVDSMHTVNNGALLTLQELDEARFDHLDSIYRAQQTQFRSRFMDTLDPKRRASSETSSWCCGTPRRWGGTSVHWPSGSGNAMNGLPRWNWTLPRVPHPGRNWSRPWRWNGH